MECNICRAADYGLPFFLCFLPRMRQFLTEICGAFDELFADIRGNMLKFDKKTKVWYRILI